MVREINGRIVKGLKGHMNQEGLKGRRLHRGQEGRRHNVRRVRLRDGTFDEANKDGIVFSFDEAKDKKVFIAKVG